QANASFVVVPPKAAPDAVRQAAGAGIPIIVCITEGIPAQDEVLLFNELKRDRPGTQLIGPNCPGVISPGKCNIGITAGEIGGAEEEKAADYIKAEMDKPVVAYIAGVTAPPGKKMGHAGAIISGSSGTAQAKIDALEAAGAQVGRNPTEMAELMREVVAG